MLQTFAFSRTDAVSESADSGPKAFLEVLKRLTTAQGTAKVTDQMISFGF
jgi:hypothetical protein